MNRYKVRWMEIHEATIHAVSEEKAIDVAYSEDNIKTLHKTVLEDIVQLGGYCDEHALEYDGECCAKCYSEPQGDGDED